MLQVTDIPIRVFTNDKNSHLLQGFQRQWRKYCGLTPVGIVGYNPPEKLLQNGFFFISQNSYNTPAEDWSTDLRKYLYYFKRDLGPHMLMMLEDYWLCDYANIEVINEVYAYMLDNPHLKILRIDLSNDRYQKPAKKLYDELSNGLQLYRTFAGSNYQMSFQAAIWNVKLLREVLIDHEDPWQSEVNGTKRLMFRDDLIVLGTNRHPLRYVPVYRSKRGVYSMKGFTKEDAMELKLDGFCS